MYAIKQSRYNPNNKQICYIEVRLLFRKLENQFLIIFYFIAYVHLLKRKLNQIIHDK